MLKNRIQRAVVSSIVVMAAIAGIVGFNAWRAGLAVAPEKADAIAEQAVQNTLDMQSMLSDRLEQSLTGEQSARMNSDLGLALFRKCVEWTEFVDNHPGVDAEENRRIACQEYRRYVESGQIPDLD